MNNFLQNKALSPLFSAIHLESVAEPLNSKLNVSKLEKFLNTKLPDWELIFNKNINKIIKNYDN